MSIPSSSDSLSPVEPSESAPEVGTLSELQRLLQQGTVRVETSSHRQPASSSPDDPMTQLRQLLLAPEQQELAELRVTVAQTSAQVSAEQVGTVFTEAFLRSHKNDPALLPAVRPLIEQTLHQSVQENPGALVTALYPVMGPAIRRSVAEALAQAVEQMTYALDHAFSLRSWRWRIQAWATGRKFHEVVLASTIVYRVEQVFLIHRDSGLLLQHVAAAQINNEEGPRDADMVSGMLTAIQDFVRDSFSTKDGEGLERVKVGDLNVWIERGPHALLAASVRGNAPSALAGVLRDALEQSHRLKSAQMGEYSGDSSVFDELRPVLMRCLQSEYQPKKKPSKIPVLLFLLSCLAGVGYLGYKWSLVRAREQKWGRAVAALAKQPGIVVVGAQSGRPRGLLHGLADPDATDPVEFMRAQGFPMQVLEHRWEPFIALHPTLVLARLLRTLKAPPGVDVQLADGVVRLHGEATQAWVHQAQVLCLATPGVRDVQVDVELTDVRAALVAALAQQQQQVEALRIHFPVWQATLLPSEQPLVERAVTTIAALLSTARQLHRSVRVEISGGADPRGALVRNQALRQARAQVVRKLLEQAGLPSAQLATSTLPQDTLPAPRIRPDESAADRCVVFKVFLTSPQRPGSPP